MAQAQLDADGSMRECSHSGRRCGARNSCVCLFETSFQTLAQAGDCLAFLLSRGLLHPFVPAESPRQAPCAIHGEGQRPDLGAGQQPGLLLTRQINPELFEGSVLALTESRGAEQNPGRAGGGWGRDGTGRGGSGGTSAGPGRAPHEAGAPAEPGRAPGSPSRPLREVAEQRRPLPARSFPFRCP